DDNGQERTMDKQEWNGEGLPTVGVKCEVRHIGVWHETTIVGSDGGLPVFKTDWCARYAYACGSDFDFRPARSAEDRAVEAMVSATDEHLTPEDTCRALYRAGYRKVEE
ncbi:hypothetical protein TW86_13510, partial [Halomonas sp. S2151]|uniref:hypothetical protein n=1 Tax=Halomonas sp. S2151 TaxID=579478 RepID=UPI0005FA46ED